METRARRRKRMRELELSSIETMDRFSNLPEHLVHEIISRVPSRACARLSVLSKKWQYLVKTLHSINFDLKEFRHGIVGVQKSKVEEFMTKYFSPRNPHILQKVRISTHSMLHSRLADHLRKCVGMAACGRIQELDLHFWHYENQYSNRNRNRNRNRIITDCVCSTVPSIFFHFPLRLKVLKLEGCHVRDTAFARLPVLKVLTLAHLHIEDVSILEMVNSCPRLENLVITCCWELTNVKLSSTSLHRLVIKHCAEVQSVFMDLPSLCTFEYDNSERGQKKQPSTETEITEFRTKEGVKLLKLEALYLACVKLDSETLNHIFAIFPNLVDLRMNSCLVNYQNQAFPTNLKKVYVVDVHVPELIEGFTSCVEDLHCDSTVNGWGFNSYVITRIVNFVCLKSVTLTGFFIISNAALNRFISSCPILEILNLRDCLSLKQVSISSKVLKVLTVKTRSNCIESVDIETPNLVFFKYDGPLILFSRLVFSPALVCILRFNRGYSLNTLKANIGKFKNASRLTVVERNYQIVYSNTSNSVLPYWCNWSHLKMKSRLFGMFRQICDDIPDLLFVSGCFLTMSIELCSLSIQLEFADRVEQDIIGLHLAEVHDCLKDHLVTATVENFEGKPHEIGVLKFLFSQANHLRTLSITMKSGTVPEFPPTADELRNLANIPATALINIASG